MIQEKRSLFHVIVSKKTRREIRLQFKGLYYSLLGLYTQLASGQLVVKEEDGSETNVTSTLIDAIYTSVITFEYENALVTNTSTTYSEDMKMSIHRSLKSALFLISELEVMPYSYLDQKYQKYKDFGRTFPILKTAINNSVNRFYIQHLADLSDDEFSEDDS